MDTKKILVVDDEQEILKMMERFISKLGYDVVVADNWESAIQAFSEDSYHLVILDVHMPGRDGFQIAKEIKIANPDQKIMIMTGLSAGEAYSYLASVEVDVNQILYKPFDINKLREIVTKLLDT